MGQLEVLLLLRRNPDRWWTADEVNRELRTSLHSAEKHLHELLEAQLLERSDASEQPSFRFRPADPELSAVAAKLDQLFPQWVSSIVDAIYETRQDSIREFADAFRLKKKADDESE